MKHKKQHFVPISYLKVWCDPSTPKDQEPYVWVVSKDGKGISRKAPKNVFSGTDFYTVYDENGSRNIELEHELKKIEDDFLYVRDKLRDHQLITDDNLRALASFVVTAFARTKFQKGDQGEIWEELLDIYKSIGIQKDNPDLYEQVEKLREQPMHYFLFNFIRITLPVLVRMNLTIIETSREPGFITSDNPVLWIDPSILLSNHPLTFFGLGSPTLEILMPISPYQIVIFSWTERKKYILDNSEPRMVNEINKMIVGFSEENVIIHHNKPNLSWFSNI